MSLYLRTVQILILRHCIFESSSTQPHFCPFIELMQPNYMNHSCRHARKVFPPFFVVFFYLTSVKTLPEGWMPIYSKRNRKNMLTIITVFHLFFSPFFVWNTKPSIPTGFPNIVLHWWNLSHSLDSIHFRKTKRKGEWWRVSSVFAFYCTIIYFTNGTIIHFLMSQKR